MTEKLFPWGDVPLTQLHIFVCMFFFNALTGVVVVLLNFDDGWSENGFSQKQAKGMMLVTFFFVVLNFTLMGTKMNTRDVSRPRGPDFEFRPVDVPHVEENCEYIGSRSMGNFLEQQIVFIVPFWIYGALINWRVAEVLGALWVGMRFMYPICYGFFGTFNWTVEIVTQWNYAIVFFFSFEFMFQGFGYEFTRNMGNKWYLPLVELGLSSVFFILSCGVIGDLFAKVIASGRERYKFKLEAKLEADKEMDV